MSTLSYGRSRSGDRFYNPPAIRQQLQMQHKQHQLQQQQQQLLLQKQKHQQQQNQQHQQLLEREEIKREKQNHDHQRRQIPVPAPAPAESSENRPESDECTVASVSSQSNLTNLDRFLEYTTPLVPAHWFSKTSMKGWRSQEDGFRPYFVLGDLWESFKEWSAYGAGVPLLLNGSDSVVQYYVPYLSGIQLYINSSKPSPRIRRPSEESDESSRESSSDGSSDSELERGARCCGVQSHQDVVDSTLQGVKGLSLRNNPCNGSSSDEGEFSSSPGALIFEYFEHDPPYSREPLADKISLLASHFPELKTYKSCDLSPSSWISVAWYPIYRIPTGPTLQNLDSCFLTFHSLSTHICGAQNESQCHYGSSPKEFPNGFDMALKLSLPIFGMASYKFKLSVWDQTSVDECPKANSLLQAADEWLQLLNVNHPDFRFFISHNFYWR